jgi:hypothetical protein
VTARNEIEHGRIHPRQVAARFPRIAGKAAPRSEMPVLEEEQGPPAAGAIERTLLDHA